MKTHDVTEEPRALWQLRFGDALALLAGNIGPDQAEHDSAAMLLLSAATGQNGIRIARRPSGRPRLLPPYAELGVSMSYRSGFLMLGFEPQGKVGVDIELADRDNAPDPYRLARDHFAPGEAAVIQALPRPQASDLFLRLWVAKEAVLKLSGRGVFDGMANPDLSRLLCALREEDFAVVPDATDHAARVEVTVRRPTLADLAAPAYCAIAHRISA